MSINLYVIGPSCEKLYLTQYEVEPRYHTQIPFLWSLQILIPLVVVWSIFLNNESLDIDNCFIMESSGVFSFILPDCVMSVVFSFMYNLVDI